MVCIFFNVDILKLAPNWDNSKNHKWILVMIKVQDHSIIIVVTYIHQYK